ncbi:uncharacterized protein [Physcomitrium patens]|uniref:uncharacterized protein isoform X4 n=1 Tax=Physcomitrium patens TaxID=3218 RepID=UPI003CCE4C33
MAMMIKVFEASSDHSQQRVNKCCRRLWCGSGASSLSRKVSFSSAVRINSSHQFSRCSLLPLSCSGSYSGASRFWAGEFGLTPELKDLAPVVCWSISKLWRLQHGWTGEVHERSAHLKKFK